MTEDTARIYVFGIVQIVNDGADSVLLHHVLCNMYAMLKAYDASMLHTSENVYSIGLYVVVSGFALVIGAKYPEKQCSPSGIVPNGSCK